MYYALQIARHHTKIYNKMEHKYLYTDFARFEIIEEPNPIIDKLLDEMD